MPEPETVIIGTIREILERRTDGDLAIVPDSDLYEDLDMDSLELAELSAVLEDDLGTDPYTAGILPQTVGDIIAFYAAAG